MKTIITPAYIFTPSAGTLDLSMVPNFSIKNLYAVLDQTVGTLIYAAGTAGYGYTAKTAGSGGPDGKLTLSASMTGLNSGDDLMIIYNDVSGTNFSGYSGSLNFGPSDSTLTLSASSYALGACIGGLKTLSILRNTAQPSATLAQIMFQWPSGAAATPVVVLLFSKMPQYTTFTDGAVPTSIDARDTAYLIAAPQSITPVSYPGVLAIPTGYAAGSWPVKNADSTPSTNIYIAVLAGAAIATNVLTPAYLLVSGVQD